MKKYLINKRYVLDEKISYCSTEDPRKLRKVYCYSLFYWNWGKDWKKEKNIVYWYHLGDYVIIP